MAKAVKADNTLGRRLLVERRIAVDEEAAPGSTKVPARSVTVNLGESPLGWLAARGRISRRQFDAGEQLRRDWTIAQLGPRVTMRWEAGARGSPRNGELADPTLAQIAAKQRFHAAIDAVGPGLSDVLWRVACACEGLEMAEKALGWPVRAGKVVLALALDRLGDHYGMK